MTKILCYGVKCVFNEKKECQAEEILQSEPWTLNDGKGLVKRPACQAYCER